MTPQEQSILEAASRRSIDDGAELDFLMGTRDTLAEQKASLETLLATSQSETRQWMAEAERWKQLAQNTTTPTAATVSHVGLEVVFDNGQSQTLRAVP